MRKTFYTMALFLLVGMIACQNSNTKEDSQSMKTEDNILLKEFDTPFGVPPFNKIKISDYKPAYDVAIAEKKAEINAIINNPEEPTFKNTIEAIEFSGKTLERVENVFENLLSSNTNDEMEALAQEITPRVTALYDGILMNDSLFQRVKYVHDNCDQSKLSQEEKMLLKETYKSFVRGGANLKDDAKERLKEINVELGKLSLNFGSNVLKETNKALVIVDKKEDLSGLPEGVVEAAAANAKDKEMEGKWVFTVQKSSMIPLLTYADKRELREQILKAYITRGDHNDELDNKENVKKMVNLRLEKAKLMGYSSYAAYVLEDNMAKTPERANQLVNDVFVKAVAKAKTERDDLQALADKLGDNIKIEAWDWWYYTEKLRKAKYDISEEEIRPYFQLENVKAGIFDMAGKLYGLTFKLNKELPVMDSLAEAYEVYRNDKLQAVLYMDYFPRESKRVGAWMTAFRKQYRNEAGENVIPIISITTNFTPATATKPALLNMDETTTLFHEFGHSLHGMLSDCKYESLSGTSVPRDFVELPSQIHENWATAPEFMKTYAKHYQTGEAIPDALIEKMEKSSTFNNGFVVTEFDAAAALDMAWHSITEPFTGDVNQFEKETMDKLGLIDEIVVRYRSTYYSHIFSGGYAAGYYSYLWTAVLDADAFGAFQETSLFDKKTANSFRENILSKGGTEDAETMWLNFRGREPKVDFYLKRMGI
jgi:peptidyl-dipeptidase Dcp